MEALLDTTFEDPPPQYPTTPVEKAHVFTMWKRYWEVIKIKLLHYGESIHSPKDFPIPEPSREVQGAAEVNEKETDCESTGSETREAVENDGSKGELVGEDALWGTGRSSSKERSKITLLSGLSGSE